MMHTSVVIAALCLTVIAVSATPQSKYTDRYDNVDLNEIMSNERLRKPYIHCLLDTGRCSADGKELKSHIREALSNKCAKCTEKQREGSRFVIGYLINNDSANWQKLAAKYDPQRRYVTEYESELKKVAGK